MFELLGRMRVEPGQSPVWEEKNRNPHGRWGTGRFGRRFGMYGGDYVGNRDINMPMEMQAEMHENIQRKIEESLLNKFQKSPSYTNLEKQSIQMTVMAQVKVHAKVIFEEASDRVKRNVALQRDAEHMTEDELIDAYYSEIENEAANIVLNEFDFPEHMDIEKFAQREKQVKEKLKNGEITLEEAYERLKEPIIIHKEREEENFQKYEEIYEGYRTRSKEERDEDSINKEATSTRNKREVHRSGRYPRQDKSAAYRKKMYVPPEERAQKENQSKEGKKVVEKGSQLKEGEKAEEMQM